MTTVMDKPYMMLARQNPDEPPLQGNDRYEGYCKDLAAVISKETNINFVIRPVKDGKYGSPDETQPGNFQVVSITYLASEKERQRTYVREKNNERDREMTGEKNTERDREISDEKYRETKKQ